MLGVFNRKFSFAKNTVLNNIFYSQIEKESNFSIWLFHLYIYISFAITSEELDTILENNLEPKDVNKNISIKTKEMFFLKHTRNFKYYAQL